MKSLKESLLDNIDNTLNTKTPYKELYPLPTVKDFVKNIYSKHQSVKWQCPELIKPYLNEIASITDCNYVPSKATGLECNIDNFKCISVFLINKDGHHLTDLTCIGDWVSNSLPTTKKECINFFKTILDNPETCFRKIIDYMQKAKQSKAQYGFADCITFEKLFK
jgi:hypothetical protein